MSKLLYIILLQLFTINLFEVYSEDSILIAIKNQQDIDAIKTLNENAIRSFEEKPELSIKYFNKSIQIASESNNIEALVKTFQNMGISYQYLNEIDSAKKYFSISKQLAAESKNETLLSNALNNYSNFNIELNNDIDAINNLFELLYLYDKNDSTTKAKEVRIKIIRNLIKNDSYNSAFDQIDLYKNQYKFTRLDSIEILLIESIVLQNLKEYSKSNRLYKAVIDKYKHDIAPEDHADIMLNIGFNYLNISNLDSALYYFEVAKFEYGRLNDINSFSLCLINLAEVNMIKGKLSDVKIQLNEFAQLYNSVNNTNYLFDYNIMLLRINNDILIRKNIFSKLKSLINSNKQNELTFLDYFAEFAKEQNQISLLDSIRKSTSDIYSAIINKTNKYEYQYNKAFERYTEKINEFRENQDKELAMLIISILFLMFSISIIVFIILNYRKNKLMLKKQSELNEYNLFVQEYEQQMADYITQVLVPLGISVSKIEDKMLYEKNLKAYRALKTQLEFVDNFIKKIEGVRNVSRD